MYGIPEDEYLKMMEVACRPRDASRMSWDWDSAAQAHIVTGMEPGKVTTAGGKTLWLQDNRFRGLASAFTGKDDIAGAFRSNASHTIATLQSAAERHGVEGVKESVRDLVLARVSTLVLISPDKLSSSLRHPLADFGMDSMITAELRSWAWKELKAEIPFMALLEGGVLLSDLVDLVWSTLR